MSRHKDLIESCAILGVDVDFADSLILNELRQRKPPVPERDLEISRAKLEAARAAARDLVAALASAIRGDGPAEPESAFGPNTSKPSSRAAEYLDEIRDESIKIREALAATSGIDWRRVESSDLQELYGALMEVQSARHFLVNVIERFPEPSDVDPCTGKAIGWTAECGE